MATSRFCSPFASMPNSAARDFTSVSAAWALSFHYIAKLAGEEQLAAAEECFVASTNKMSPPAGVQARPVATPGTLVRIAVSGSYSFWPQYAFRKRPSPR